MTPFSFLTGHKWKGIVNTLPFLAAAYFSGRVLNYILNLWQQHDFVVGCWTFLEMQKQTVFKKKGVVHCGTHGPVPIFLRCRQFRHDLIFFLKRSVFSSLNIWCVFLLLTIALFIWCRFYTAFQHFWNWCCNCIGGLRRFIVMLIWVVIRSCFLLWVFIQEMYCNIRLILTLTDYFYVFNL